MPMYEYECKPCKHLTRIIRSVDERKTPTKCERCGKDAAFIISMPGGFQFKGPGFYETDYKRRGK